MIDISEELNFAEYYELGDIDRCFRCDMDRKYDVWENEGLVELKFLYNTTYNIPVYEYRITDKGATLIEFNAL